MKPAVLTAAAVLIATTVGASAGEFRYRCAFKGYPVMVLDLPTLEAAGTLRIGNARPIPLQDSGSVGTGLEGHVYGAEVDGKSYSFALGVSNADYNPGLDGKPIHAPKRIVHSDMLIVDDAHAGETTCKRLKATR